MNWIPLRSTEDLEQVIHLSQEKPQVIFKHSTRCNISSVAKNRLERAGGANELQFHYLDLISYRSLSNAVAERFGIEHESPQILVIKNGKCIYNESHMGIDMEDIKDQVQLN